MLHLSGLKPVKLWWVINICLTNAVWFIASIKHQGKYRVTVFIVVHLVKRFVWDRSVFTQHSYYREFFCSGPASRIRYCHCHGWVRYIDTTKITVWCMSSLLLYIDILWFCYFIMFYFKLSQNLSFLANIESVHFFNSQTQNFRSRQSNPQPSIFDH